MKKVVALLLVLGLSVVANAALVFNVTKDGVPVEGDTITLEPSDTLVIDIIMTAGSTNFTAGLLLDGEKEAGSLDWSQATLADSYAAFGQVFPFDLFVKVSELFPPVGDDEVSFEGGNILSPIFADAPVVEGVVFHCDGVGTVVLDMVSRAVGADTLVSSLEIIQVPEPITMTLLGLGGLVLRRRR